jgi:hypothetical protein
MTAIVERIWVPSAAVVPQQRGAEFIAPVDDADWSEGIGYNRGFFSAFRIRQGKDVWFHFPLPTPTERNGHPMALASGSLLWEVLDGAAVTWVVLQHGGMERMPLTDRLAEPAYEDVPFDPPEKWREYYPASSRRLSRFSLAAPLPLQFGLQLSIGISAADHAGTVRFYGAGADFCHA